MKLFAPSELAFVQTVARLAYSNPFLPERIDFEKEALGDAFVARGAVWNLRPEGESVYPNIERLVELCTNICDRAREKMISGTRIPAEEHALYVDLIFFLLYNRHQPSFGGHILRSLERGSAAGKLEFWPDFQRDVEHYLTSVAAIPEAMKIDAPQLFAFFFQVRRAFHLLFRSIVGGSMPAARLRAEAWQSIFTHDMRRFRRVMWTRMGDLTCLITGPSGTGKELVARAIGMSRFIPFDPGSRSFTEDFIGNFHPLNLSALSPTLIESELFGHRRGAFTGALQDRTGWLEICRPCGAVFLDEIGELDAGIQVKLLRVLQSRTFQRLGDTETRRFQGKIIAATNRDLAKEMREGHFREDFYYRICSDMITTPSLYEQLQDAPGDLHNLVMFIASRLVGEEEAIALTKEVEGWIEKNLPKDYRWPGNVRELEQCVRNILIRKAYVPPEVQKDKKPSEELLQAFESGTLTADELLSRYCTLVYSQTKNYQETARRLGLDHRTVKAKIDADLLEKVRPGGNGAD